MKKALSIKNILGWLDNNLISLLAGFLLVFIPLYPKLPLFDILPGYIVRIRLEDFFIAFTIVVWFIWLIRKKISLKNNPLVIPVLIYLGIGVLSMLSAVLITKTVPFELIHIGKLLLHYIRRIEYFSLFFIMYSAIKSPKHLKVYTLIILFTVLSVTLYGYGQKYLYWPAFSTMNREFSKGWLLYLTDHARVLSTFGGHYDLAAFTMMSLILIWSLFFGAKKLLVKIGLFAVLAGAFWLLILTASRISFIAYIAGLSVMVFLWIFRKNFSWVLSRWALVTFISIFTMLSFGDLSERFTKLLRLDERLGGLKEIILRPATKAPTDKAYFLVNDLSAVTSKSDQPPSPVKPDSGTNQKPSDVIDVNNNLLEPYSDPNDPTKVLWRKRVYSQAALKYDLSTGIRFDALWPRAIKGFMTNPLLGTGYATLTKIQLTEFTEAESTDNDYLRMLGETGLLGALSFLGIIAVVIITIWKALPGVKDNWLYGLLIGGIALTAGLLINASYIDVFEASKVAYAYWGFIGLVLGAIAVNRSDINKNKQPLRIQFNFREFTKSFIEGVKSDTFLLIIILILGFYLRLYRIDAPLADWHSWRQADTASVTRNFHRDGINLLYPTYDDLSSIASGKPNPKGLRLVEFPVYNAASVFVKKIIPEGPIERSMRLTSIFASLASTVFIFFITRKYLGKKTAYISALLFSVLPYNIFYSRVILPEPFLVMLSLGFVYFFDCFITNDKEKKSPIKMILYFLLSLLFGALAVLVKPFALFLSLPALYLAFAAYGIKIFRQKKLYLLIVLILLPFGLWRLWISQFPEGIPAYSWLFNGDNIRFKGAFFYWLFAERVGKLILGYWGLPLFIIGFLARRKLKEGWLFYLWLVSILAYLAVIATGNVRHDYYQVFIIPVLVIFMAKGIDCLIFGNPNFSRAKSVLMVIICVIFMEAFGWYQIRDYFNINHPEIVQAGEALDKIASKKALVIAPYGGDTAFLYQTKRAGWPIMEGDIQQMIKKGAHYYVSVNFNQETNQILEQSTSSYLQEKFFIVAKTNQYVIIQLVPNFALPKD